MMAFFWRAPRLYYYKRINATDHHKVGFPKQNNMSRTTLMRLFSTFTTFLFP